LHQSRHQSQADGRFAAAAMGAGDYESFDIQTSLCLVFSILCMTGDVLLNTQYQTPYSQNLLAW
jgi:hypothetical protein